MKKRMVALLLVLCMAVSLVPVQVVWAEGEETPSDIVDTAICFAEGESYTAYVGDTCQFTVVAAEEDGIFGDIAWNFEGDECLGEVYTEDSEPNSIFVEFVQAGTVTITASEAINENVASISITVEKRVTPVGLGFNFVDAPFGEFATITFAPEEDGVYLFYVEGKSVYSWSASFLDEDLVVSEHVTQDAIGYAVYMRGGNVYKLEVTSNNAISLPLWVAKAADVTGIAIDDVKTIVNVNESVTPKALAMNHDGVLNAVEWSVEGPATLEKDASGITTVTFTAVGEVTLTATDLEANVSGSVVIRVKDPYDLVAELGKTYTVETCEDFLFTPTESGKYTFYGENFSPMDGSWTVTEIDSNAIISGMAWGKSVTMNKSVFGTTWELEKDKTYLLSVSMRGGLEKTITVTLNKVVAPTGIYFLEEKIITYANYCTAGNGKISFPQVSYLPVYAEVDPATQVEFTSSNTDVVSILETGMARLQIGENPGNAILTATYNGLSATIPVEVVDAVDLPANKSVELGLVAGTPAICKFTVPVDGDYTFDTESIPNSVGHSYTIRKQGDKYHDNVTSWYASSGDRASNTVTLEAGIQYFLQINRSGSMSPDADKNSEVAVCLNVPGLAEVGETYTVDGSAEFLFVPAESGKYTFSQIVDDMNHMITWTVKEVDATTTVAGTEWIAIDQEIAGDYHIRGVRWELEAGKTYQIEASVGQQAEVEVTFNQSKAPTSFGFTGESAKYYTKAYAFSEDVDTLDSLPRVSYAPYYAEFDASKVVYTSSNSGVADVTMTEYGAALTTGEAGNAVLTATYGALSDTISVAVVDAPELVVNKTVSETPSEYGQAIYRFNVPADGEYTIDLFTPKFSEHHVKTTVDLRVKGTSIEDVIAHWQILDGEKTSVTVNLEAGTDYLLDMHPTTADVEVTALLKSPVAKIEVLSDLTIVLDEPAFKQNDKGAWELVDPDWSALKFALTMQDGTTQTYHFSDWKLVDGVYYVDRFPVSLKTEAKAITGACELPITLSIAGVDATFDVLVIEKIVSDGQVTVTPSVVENALKNADGDVVVIDAVSADEAKVDAINLPAKAMQKVADAKADVVVKLDAAEVVFEDKAIASIMEQTESDMLSLSVEKCSVADLSETQQKKIKKAMKDSDQEPLVLDITLLAADEAITSFNGGEVTIRVPFTPPTGTNGEDFDVWYISKDGEKVQKMKTTYEDGFLVFVTNHFSDYVALNGALDEEEDIIPPNEPESTEPTGPNTEGTTPPTTEGTTPPTTEGTTPPAAEGTTPPSTEGATTAPTAKPESDTPMTGDTSAVFGFTALLVVSGLMVCAMLVLRKKIRV